MPESLLKEKSLLGHNGAVQATSSSTRFAVLEWQVFFMQQVGEKEVSCFERIHSGYR